MPKIKPIDLPEVSFSDGDGVRYLHLGTPWVQGSMLIKKPFDIELEYVQRMMAWLLWADLDKLASLRTVQLGLGAATLTKFCYKKLKCHATAIELNPQVLLACRTWFKLPPDDARLKVIIADAGLEIKNPLYAANVDALQVDIYDDDAAAPVLDSPEFYADCRTALSPGGMLSVNLFGRNASFERSLEKICRAFGADCVWTFRPTREGNTIVLAQRNRAELSRVQLAQKGEIIHTRWGLPAHKWLRILKPVA
jgi:spermidine synthase